MQIHLYFLITDLVYLRADLTVKTGEKYRHRDYPVRSGQVSTRNQSKDDFTTVVGNGRIYVNSFDAYGCIGFCLERFFLVAGFSTFADFRKIKAVTKR